MLEKTLILSLLMLTKASANNYVYCGLDNKSQKLAQLVIEAKGQNRTSLTCNHALAMAANKKAKQMAESEKVSHYIDYISPNELLTNEGIELPYSYEKIGNQVEVVSGGMRTSKKAFKHFLTSETHKSHLLAEEEFYLSQNFIGVGHYKDSSKSHVDYWVIYITEFRSEDERPQPVLTIKLNKPTIAKKLKRKK